MLVAMCTCTRGAAPRRCAAGGVLGEVAPVDTWACMESSSTAGVLARSMRLVHVDLAARHAWPHLATCTWLHAGLVPAKGHKMQSHTSSSTGQFGVFSGNSAGGSLWCVASGNAGAFARMVTRHSNSNRRSALPRRCPMERMVANNRGRYVKHAFLVCNARGTMGLLRNRRAISSDGWRQVRRGRGSGARLSPVSAHSCACEVVDMLV